MRFYHLGYSDIRAMQDDDPIILKGLGEFIPILRARERLEFQADIRCAHASKDNHGAKELRIALAQEAYADDEVNLVTFIEAETRMD